MQKYDCAIVGGGLAGLSLSIRLALRGKKVILFEKDHYPKHRVCGEYISLETVDFLKSCGFDIEQHHLPIIKKLNISSPNGTMINHNLTLGGFGVSRYKLDYELYQLALKAGVEVLTQTQVTNILHHTASNTFEISTETQSYISKVCIGSFGKRSNLDIKWNRAFLKKDKKKIANFVGVKYHIRCDLAPDTIELHNFEDGYCGVSQIEEGKYCFCYLTTAEIIKKNKNIKQFEQNVMAQNPYLKKYFENATFIFDEPITISQINFSNKQSIENHVIMAGDSAGLIAPLCGNGMAMALNSAQILEDLILSYLDGKISQKELEKQYTKSWNEQFSTRLWVGRNIQLLFGKNIITNLLISSIKPFPTIVKFLESLTHG